MVQDVAGSNPVGRPFAMRVHCVQFDIAWEDKAASQTRIEDLLEASPPEAGDLVVLPELADVGFSLALDRIVDDRSQSWAQDFAARHGIWLLHGWPSKPDDAGRNIAGLLRPDGSLCGTAEKLHPFTAGHEDRAYAPGKGPVILDLDGILLCPLICYDLRFPETFRMAVSAGAEVFTVTANWPLIRADHWRTLLRARAIENQAVVIGCNRTGSDPHMTYFGGSMVIDAKGQVLAEGHEKPEVISATIDVEAIRTWRAEFPAIRDMRDWHWKKPHA